MKYSLEVDVSLNPDIDAAGFSAVLAYAINAQLKSLPGVSSVSISEIRTSE